MENRDFFRISYLSFSLLLFVSVARPADPGTLALVTTAGKWLYQTAATVGLTMLGAKSINQGRFNAQTFDFDDFDGSFDVRKEVAKAADALIHNDSSVCHNRGLESSTNYRSSSVYDRDIPTEEERLRPFKPVAKNPPIIEPQKTAHQIKANAAIKEKEEMQKTKGYEDSWIKQMEHLEDKIERAYKAGNTKLVDESIKEIANINRTRLKSRVRKDSNPFLKEDIEPEIVWKVPATGKEKLSDRRRVDQDPDPRNNGATEIILPKRDDEKEKASHHHIFRNEDGHIVECTPEAEKLIQQAFREGIHLGQDYFHNHHYVWINPTDKAQFWLKVRPNLKLTDGGANAFGSQWIQRPDTQFLVKPKGFKALGKGVKYGLVGIGAVGFEMGIKASENAIERERHQQREAARAQVRKTREERYKESREAAIAYDYATIATAKELAKSSKVANINKRGPLSGPQPAPQRQVVRSAPKVARTPPPMNTAARSTAAPALKSVTVRNNKGGVTTTF